jgi:hypothetical protein
MDFTVPQKYIIIHKKVQLLFQILVDTDTSAIPQKTKMAFVKQSVGLFAYPAPSPPTLTAYSLQKS